MRELTDAAINKLDDYKLVRFNRKSDFVTTTELGRVTSLYYINC